MGHEPDLLTAEQKDSFRRRIASYGFDPERVIAEGGGEIQYKTIRLAEIRDLFDVPEDFIEPPPPLDKEDFVQLAEDYVFKRREMNATELAFLEGKMGPFTIGIAAKPDLEITKEKPLVLTGGIEIREYGTIKIKPGGQIIIRDCVAKIQCEHLVMEG